MERDATARGRADRADGRWACLVFISIRRYLIGSESLSPVSLVYTRPFLPFVSPPLLCCVYTERQPLQRLLVCPKQPQSIVLAPSLPSRSCHLSEPFVAKQNGLSARSADEMPINMRNDRGCETKKYVLASSSLVEAEQISANLSDLAPR